MNEKLPNLIDAISDESVLPHLVDELEKDPNIEVEVVKGLELKRICFNMHKEGPLQDVNVRTAFQYAIDRDLIVEMVYQGYVEKYNSRLYSEDPLYKRDVPPLTLIRIGPAGFSMRRGTRMLTAMGCATNLKEGRTCPSSW